ncbi:chorismate mutase [Defluviitalea phaphyphila]|uniref:chorismate mutase n=1 Tax=Defluviitalea phaphyphila TaxID=1473580 RepID=UPI0007310428|nr:chorismate mutase [Defluviitalea phaphyphila]
MCICAIRGAITVEKNTKEDILKNTQELLEEIIYRNNIDIKDIISIIFTATDDIDAAYPAIAARNLKITHAALLCFQEMKVQNSLKMCIRVMVQIKTEKSQIEMKHVYLKGAVVLRPDLLD